MEWRGEAGGESCGSIIGFARIGLLVVGAPSFTKVDTKFHEVFFTADLSDDESGFIIRMRDAETSSA